MAGPSGATGHGRHGGAAERVRPWRRPTRGTRDQPTMEPRRPERSAGRADGPGQGPPEEAPALDVAGGRAGARRPAGTPAVGRRRGGGPCRRQPADAPPDHAGAPAVGGLARRPPGRRRGGGQAAVLLSDAEGVRVLQPALAPGADARGPLHRRARRHRLRRRGRGRAVRARAGRAGPVRRLPRQPPVGDAPVGADGAVVRRRSPARPPGVYTLRVDQLDAAGRRS